jgi:multidrug efflux system outer membrane protein
MPPTFSAYRAPTGSSAEEVPPGITLSPDEARFVASFSPDGEGARIVTVALASNPDMRKIATEVAQARAQAASARSSLFPQSSAVAQRDRVHMDDPNAQALLGRDFTSATLDLHDELDFFGRLNSLSEAAAHEYLGSRAAQVEARGALIAEVLGAYVNERATAEIDDKLRYADQAADALLANAEKQQSVGTLSADDLQARRDQEIKVHLARMDADRRQAEALRYLQSLSGYRLASPVSDLASLGRADPASDRLASLPSDVLLSRPDVVRAEERLRAANANIGAARAAFFPSIQLSSSLGHVSSDLDHLFNANTGGWTFLPQLNVPLFDGGARRADLDLAKARKHSAVADYESTVQHAFREVADALDERESATARMSRMQPMCRADAERLKKALARHAAGLEDPSGVLARSIDAAQVQMDCLAAQRDQALSRLAVFRVFYGVVLPSHPPADPARG